MLSLKEYKMKLGDIADNMSDDEILKLQKEQYRFAEIAWDIWINRNLAKKYDKSDNIGEPYHKL